MFLLWLSYLTAAGGLLLIVARWLRRPVPRRSALVLLGLPILFCLPGFFRGATIFPVDQLAHFPPWSTRVSMAPHNPYLNDVATQIAPWAKAVRMAWKEGSLPLRNRWNGCGSALAANGQSAAFSPFTFAMAALPLAHGFTLIAALEIFLALSGMWLWLRELGVSTTSSLLGAIAFAFSLTMTPWLLFPLAGVFCLSPWALFATELALSSGRPAVGLALCVAVFSAWILAGHPESACLGGVGIGLYLGGRFLLRDPTFRSGGTLRVCGAGLLAVALTAFLWVPQIRAIRASNRYAAAAELRNSLRGHAPHLPGWSLGFVSSIFPRALGDDIETRRNPRAPFSFVDMGLGYFGLVGWTLCLLILRPGRPRDRREIALLFPLLCGLAIGTGSWPFIEGLLSVPLLELVFPPRFFSWIALFGSAIAAFELDRLREDARTRSGRAIVAAVAPVLVGVAMLAAYSRLRPVSTGSAGADSVYPGFALSLATLGAAAALLLWICWHPQWSAPAGILLGAVAFGELAAQGARLYRWGEPRAFFPSSPLARFLQFKQRPFRAVGEGAALFPGTNVFAGVEEVRTHDPVERRDYVEFLDRTCGYDPKPYFKQLRDLESPALDFLNVRFLVSGDPNRGQSPRWRRVYSGPDGSVLENVRVLPRVFAPRQIRVVSQTPSSALLLPQDWEQEATIAAARGLAVGVKSNAPVEVSGYIEKTNSIRFHVRPLESGNSAFLVTSLTDDGGWTARDGRGKPVKTLRANGVFLGVVLESGSQEIRLDYAPPGLLPGSVLSVAGLAVLLTFWVWRRALVRKSEAGA
jgi:Bacterial membrane protein YfhO